MTFPAELDDYLDRCLYERNFDYDATSKEFMASALGFLRHPYTDEPEYMIRARAQEIFAASALRARWEERHGAWEVLRTTEWELVPAAPGAGDGRPAEKAAVAAAPRPREEPVAILKEGICTQRDLEPSLKKVLGLDEEETSSEVSDTDDDDLQFFSRQRVNAKESRRRPEHAGPATAARW